MELLRVFTQWILRHRVLSIFIAILIAGLVFVSRVIINRSEGVASEPLKKGVIVDAIYGIGTVTATKSFSIKPGVISTISQLNVKEGDFVRKGGLLTVLDGIAYRAPFDGVVNFLPYKVGENVFASIPFLVITDLTNRYLVVSLEQPGALRIRPNQKAKLSFDSIRNQTFEGKVESVYSYNGNFLARIDVSKLPVEILPDMTADVAIIIKEIPDALQVPVSALDKDTVWVKRSHSIPEQVKIKIGVVDGAMAEVVSGNLKEGDRVMIRSKAGS